MAITLKNRDGTYASKCAICNQSLTEPIFATSHFIGDVKHDLYRFSDAAMHWDCYVNWPHQARFASLYFESHLRRIDDPKWLNFWAVLVKTDDVLVTYGLIVREISILLRHSGTDIRVLHEEWKEWLSGEWQKNCRPGPEHDAVVAILSQLDAISLPERT
jgi:hypothetical protein